MNKKGQSIVEVAIIAPILIFMIIGVLEVGYVLRSYFVIVQASREAARFASRVGYLDLDRADIGYENVVIHARTAIAGQIDYDGFVEDSAIIISNIDVDTHQPCNPLEREEPAMLSDVNDPDYEYLDYWPNCDCDMIYTDPYTPISIKHPDTDAHYSYMVPQTVSERLELNFGGIAQDMAKQNSVGNCELAKRGLGYNTIHSLVIVEIYFYHKQLFGFPVISNPFTDPILLHAVTVMRRLEGRAM